MRRFPVFVVKPWARYVSQPWYAGHVTIFQDPDFLTDILLDKQKFQLVCGENSTMEN
jgi:hypothetical protein